MSGMFESSPGKIARTVAIMLVLLTALAGMGRSTVQAQDDDPISGPSPAESQARVIAQGISALPSGEIAWRITGETAPLPADAEFDSFSLGFIVATDGAILIADEASGAAVRLAEGEAAFIPADSSKQIVSLSDDEMPYLQIALVPSEEAEDGDDVIFSSDPFSAPEGARDLDLVSGNLGSGSVRIPSVDAPLVVMGTRGDIEIRFDDENTPFGSGEAGAFGPGLSTVIDAGDVEGAFIAAVIGPEIPDLGLAIASRGSSEATEEPESTAEPTEETTGSASVTVHALECPEGHTYPDQLDGPDPECTDPVPDFFFTLNVNDTGESLDGSTDNSGDLVFDDLAAGSYSLSFSIDGVDVRTVCGSADSGLMGNGDPLQIGENEAVDCTVNLATLPIDSTGTGDTGEIVFTAAKCPNDYEFPGDLSGIDPNCGEPLADLYIYMEQLDGGSTITDGYTSENGTLHIAGAPTGTYQFSAFPASGATSSFGIVCIGPNGSTGDIIVLDPDTQVDCYINVSEYSS